MEMNYTSGELDQIQEELHVEMLPGTEIMAEIEGHHFVKSQDKSNRVLVPQPMDDPHDPLNWKTGWKMSVAFAVSMLTFTQGFAPLSLAPMFGYLMEEYNAGLADVIQFTGVTILILGFSNFLWVPLATSFGRRPVFLASQLICLGSHIWRGKATTYNSFMGACILNGIGAGPAETLQPTVIADVFFLHDRGKWNTLYWVVYMGSLMVAPIIAGAMADHVGWRNFWWLNVALTAATIIFGAVGFPETKWHRAHPGEGQPEAAIVDPKPPTTHQEESNGEVKANDSSEATRQEPESLAHRDSYLGRGIPSKLQWQLFQPNAHPFRQIFVDLWTPWKMFAYPIVHFGAFVVSWSCSNFLIINLTQSQLFAAPPYNWSSQSIGFTNFAILAGALIGLATAGPLSDWVSARATARNRGIREPEMRLPAMIPYVLILILGNVITSQGYQQLWSWEPIVIIGYACAGIQVAALPSIASTYAVDSYKPAAGSLFVAITVNKNLWGYGLSKFITDWSIEDGFVPPFMTNMSLTVLWCLFGVVFYFYGKTFRRWTKNSSVHTM